MTETLEKAKDDIAPKWIELSQSVRRYAAAALDNPGDEKATKTFAAEALTLCDHMDRLQADLSDLLQVLENAEAETQVAEPDEREIDMAAVETQRETHELRADPLDILKALLMWRDDPAERLQRE